MDKKEYEEKISQSTVNTIIAKGPDNFFSKLREYLDDVKTLTQRMQDLYMADDEGKVIFAMLGLKVHITVETNDTKLMDMVIGSRMEKMKNEQRPA